MKKIVEFLKTSLIGGLFVLLPLVLFYLLLSELLQVVVALATPIADLFPKGTFDQVKMPVVIGIILIVGASFLFGLALRSVSLRRLGLWIETNFAGQTAALQCGEADGPRSGGRTGGQRLSVGGIQFFEWRKGDRLRHRRSR